MAVFKCHLDPCGICCLLVTYFCFIYAYYVVIGVIIIPLMNQTLWGTLNGIIFTLLITLCVTCHLKATLSDPGIIPFSRTSLDFSDLHSNTENKLDGYTVCSKCEIYRQSDAHHCRICKRCIRKRHHHCQWINNCVGEYNQRYFLQFLFYIGITSIYTICFIMFSFMAYKDTSMQDISSSTRLYHSVLLMLESITFGLFVFAIICDQLASIKTQQSLSFIYSLRQLFNSNNPFVWLIPFDFGNKNNDNTTNQKEMRNIEQQRNNNLHSV